MKRVFTYRAGFVFCGLGAGARGIIEAKISMLGQDAEFVSVGGIDNDPLSCADFEMLTGSPALCADVREVTPAMLRGLMGETAPDMIFGSPPCQGFSRLISKKKAAEPYYQELNRLVVVWLELVLASWAEPPPLILLENVEGIRHRGADLLAKCRKLLRRAGYVFNEGTHDAGEIGGLAQHRSRFLMVARLPRKLPNLLYQPPKRRVRGCGEVIGSLPLPGDAAGGKLHKLPRLIAKNWLRLALIPPGGDWRDLEGVLADGQARREVFGRYKINAWDEPTATIAGTGSNGVYGVADPRVKVAYDRGYGVLRWDEASPTVAGGSCVGQGAYAVADPRITCTPRAGAYGVLCWDSPANTITGHHKVDNAMAAVADPRIEGPRFRGSLGVIPWDKPAGVIAGESRASNGAFSVADPRPVEATDGATIDWTSRRPLDRPPILIARDGTWHRPLTMLDKAALQGLPATLNGAPLCLKGTQDQIATRVGNAVPVGAGKAMGEQALATLHGSAVGSFFLSSNPIWVEAPDALEPGWVRLRETIQ